MTSRGVSDVVARPRNRASQAASTLRHGVAARCCREDSRLPAARECRRATPPACACSFDQLGDQSGFVMTIAPEASATPFISQIALSPVVALRNTMSLLPLPS